MSVPVNMAITLDMSGDKVDTELPLMPLHRVWSCMFEQRAMRREKGRQRRRLRSRPLPNKYASQGQ